jgi:hypothetical protein
MRREELETLLRPLLWDARLDIAEAVALIERKKDISCGLTADDLYRKLLMSYNWYRLVEVLGLDYICRFVLTDSVIDRLFPTSMKKRYGYVRTLLLS